MTIINTSGHANQHVLFRSLACWENNASWHAAGSPSADKDDLFWFALTTIKQDFSKQIKLFFFLHITWNVNNKNKFSQRLVMQSKKRNVDSVEKQRGEAVAL